MAIFSAFFSILDHSAFVERALVRPEVEEGAGGQAARGGRCQEAEAGAEEKDQRVLQERHSALESTRIALLHSEECRQGSIHGARGGRSQGRARAEERHER